MTNKKRFIGDWQYDYFMFRVKIAPRPGECSLALPAFPYDRIFERHEYTIFPADGIAGAYLQAVLRYRIFP
jgi:hypothetical protein